MEPSLLEPRRAEGAARGDRVRGEQALEVDLLDDHRVALARRPALRRGQEPLGEGAAGDRTRRRARRRPLHRPARRLHQVEMLEVVAVVRSDRVRIRDEARRRGPRRRPGRRRARPGSARRRPRPARRWPRRSPRATRPRSRWPGSRPPPKGSAAHVGVERAATEQGHRRGGGQRLEPDLLRIVAGVERQLVARAGRSGARIASATRAEARAAKGRTRSAPALSPARGRGPLRVARRLRPSSAARSCRSRCTSRSAPPSASREAP